MPVIGTKVVSTEYLSDKAIITLIKTVKVRLLIILDIGIETGCDRRNRKKTSTHTCSTGEVNYRREAYTPIN